MAAAVGKAALEHVVLPLLSGPLDWLSGTQDNYNEAEQETKALALKYWEGNDKVRLALSWMSSGLDNGPNVYGVPGPPYENFIRKTAIEQCGGDELAAAKKTWLYLSSGGRFMFNAASTLENAVDIYNRIWPDKKITKKDLDDAHWEINTRSEWDRRRGKNQRPHDPNLGFFGRLLQSTTDALHITGQPEPFDEKYNAADKSFFDKRLKKEAEGRKVTADKRQLLAAQKYGAETFNAMNQLVAGDTNPSLPVIVRRGYMAQNFDNAKAAMRDVVYHLNSVNASEPVRKRVVYQVFPELAPSPFPNTPGQGHQTTTGETPWNYSAI